LSFFCNFDAVGEPQAENDLWQLVLSIKAAQLFLGGLNKRQTMARAVLFERHPFEPTFQWRTVANVRSMGFVAFKPRSVHLGVKVLGDSADLAPIMESFTESAIKLASLILLPNNLPRQKRPKSWTRPLQPGLGLFVLDAIFCGSLTKIRY
jgi:hypothetical protein